MESIKKGLYSAALVGLALIAGTKPAEAQYYNYGPGYGGYYSYPSYGYYPYTAYYGTPYYPGYRYYIGSEYPWDYYDYARNDYGRGFDYGGSGFGYAGYNPGSLWYNPGYAWNYRWGGFGYR